MNDPSVRVSKAAAVSREPAAPAARTHVSQGLTLHYLDWGDAGAPLVILMHGSRDLARSWDWTAAALVDAGYRVVAPDLRGHGDSAWSPDRAYLSSYYLLDLANLADLLGAERFDLVGHSFGGNISARYAATFPERVKTLTLVDGIGPNPDYYRQWDAAGSVVRTREWVERWRAAAAKPAPRFATIEDATARMAKGNPHLTPDQALHLARHNLRPHEGGWTWKTDPFVQVYPPEDMTAETQAVWSAIACPTLLFWGPKSFTTNPETDGRAPHFRRHRTVIYEDAGHSLHHERIGDFNGELLGFLREGDAGVD
jgi:pimeloyl-ACP methyl ester carboxylesterase